MYKVETQSYHFSNQSETVGYRTPEMTLTMFLMVWYTLCLSFMYSDNSITFEALIDFPPVIGFGIGGDCLIVEFIVEESSTLSFRCTLPNSCSFFKRWVLYKDWELLRSQLVTDRTSWEARFRPKWRQLCLISASRAVWPKWISDVGRAVLYIRKRNMGASYNQGENVVIPVGLLPAQRWGRIWWLAFALDEITSHLFSIKYSQEWCNQLLLQIIQNTHWMQ